MEDEEIVETSSDENNNITDSVEQIVLTTMQETFRDRVIAEMRTALRTIDGDTEMWDQIIEHIGEHDEEHVNDVLHQIMEHIREHDIGRVERVEHDEEHDEEHNEEHDEEHDTISSISSLSSTLSHSSDETDSESSYLNELSTEHVENLISTSIQDIEKYFESLKKQIKVLKKKCSMQQKTILSLEKENTKCRLCNRNDINIVYFPCLHLGCCAECNTQIRDDRCPFCRTDIKGVLKCYTV